MKSFSFIHAADLHLGSPFKGAGSKLPASAGQLRSATFDAFSGLIDLCLEKSVDFLLVAGDVFDLSDRSLRAQLTFRDGLARLSEADIRSFVVFGNHDPWEAWSSRISWPEKAHIFSPDHVETIIVSVNQAPAAAVSGISYRKQHQSRNLAALFKADHPDLYQIGLLHGNCGNQPDHGAYAPCSVDALRQSGLDYWALGHVHEKKILDTNPCIVYPGCTQGLSIRETGDHGCYLVSVSAERRTTLSFQPLDRIRWRLVEISIAGVETLDGLDRMIAAELAQIREAAEMRPVIGRICVTGRGPLYMSLRQPTAAEELLDRCRQLGELQSPPVWVQDIEFTCRPDVDLTRRQETDDLLGQILKTVSELGAESATLSDRLMPALKDVYENPKLSRFLATLTPADLKRLLQDSALLSYDLLESEP